MQSIRPTFLDSKDARKACQENLALFHALGQNFLKNVITEDETPLSLYVPYSKRESREWVFPEVKPSKKASFRDISPKMSHAQCVLVCKRCDQD